MEPRQKFVPKVITGKSRVWDGNGNEISSEPLPENEQISNTLSDDPFESYSQRLVRGLAEGMKSRTPEELDMIQKELKDAIALLEDKPAPAVDQSAKVSEEDSFLFEPISKQQVEIKQAPTQEPVVPPARILGEDGHWFDTAPNLVPALIVPRAPAPKVSFSPVNPDSRKRPAPPTPGPSKPAPKSSKPGSSKKAAAASKYVIGKPTGPQK